MIKNFSQRFVHIVIQIESNLPDAFEKILGDMLRDTLKNIKF